MEKWLDVDFESSCFLTDQFRAFSRDFKKFVKKNLPEDSELVGWSRGHFEISGFVKRGDKYAYFSTSDVRFFRKQWYKNMLVRSAAHEKDYTGGSNCFIALPNFKEEVSKFL